MSSTIQKVALAGATGNVGPAILSAIRNAGFDVTVLTRQGSKSSTPDPVKTVAVDYDSLESLESALKGQDALISALPLVSQKLLVDAAIKAGVKRFIPSEFGSDTLNSKSSTLPVFNPKLEMAQYLREVAPKSGLTYTRVMTGPFLDWCMAVGLFVNWKEHKIEIVDGGDRPMSSTTLASIGQAVVGALQHLDETKNRAVYTQSAVVTQNQLLKIVQKLSPGHKWEVTEAKSEDLEKIGRAEMEKENPNPYLGPYNLIKRAIYGEGYGGFTPQDKLDNALLGVHEMSSEELEGMIAKIIA